MSRTRGHRNCPRARCGVCGPGGAALIRYRLARAFTVDDFDVETNDGGMFIRTVGVNADGELAVIEGEAIPAASCTHCDAPLTPVRAGLAHCIRHGYQSVPVPEEAQA